ncbi:MAG: sugar ABC transporter ATP-binding protein [Spirochaetales bacterium]|nr:sugar ABC transporter ATP-binding protein [Spirochaetales bacterium]
MKENSSFPLMEAKNIRKVFPGTTALHNVDFKIFKGMVNALVGENGAGKSTLMKIIAGIEKPTSGTLYIYDSKGEAEEVSFNSTRDAVRKGIGIVHQELNLFSNLDVAENIFMNKEINRYGPLYIDHKSQYEKSKEILHKLGQNINPGTIVRDLRLGQQQIVEIAKTMIEDPKILIMDEPTSSLSIQEVQVLFNVISDLKKHGVAVVYISHRLEEIKEIGDYITILRDGRLVEFGEVKRMEMTDIIEKMVGRDPNKFFTGQAHVSGKELLRVKNMTLPRYGGGFTFENISFSVKEGEILGIYGLMGAGRTELLESIMGINENATGEIWLEGKRLDNKDTKQRIQHGLVLIPEDRQREGLFTNLSVAMNLTMSSIKRFLKGFHIIKRLEEKHVHEVVDEMGIKVSSPEVSVNALSGGNQQKVVIGKGLLTQPKVLLMDEPTRGIDVGAKSDVFEIMNRMANEKFGVIFVSSELEEIFSMSDRILVLSKGKITGEFDRSKATEEKIRKVSEIGHGITATA